MPIKITAENIDEVSIQVEVLGHFKSIEEERDEEPHYNFAVMQLDGIRFCNQDGFWRFIDSPSKSENAFWSDYMDSDDLTNISITSVRNAIRRAHLNSPVPDSEKTQSQRTTFYVLDAVIELDKGVYSRSRNSRITRLPLPGFEGQLEEIFQVDQSLKQIAKKVGFAIAKKLERETAAKEMREIRQAKLVKPEL